MAFFVLLHNDDEDEAFANIVSSFVTSFVMMVGEVDYRDAFLQMKSKNFVLILMFLVLFLVFMSILIMNLLTGLAVGDIGTIMKSSLAEKQRQKVNTIDFCTNSSIFLPVSAEYVLILMRNIFFNMKATELSQKK